MKELIAKGVRIIDPKSTWIDESVPQENISASAVIHPGCRISGASTSIGPGCVLGEEAPATVVNCQLGARVQLKGGFYSGSVFMDEAKTGSSAHIRPCCLLEEHSSCGHAVGLKQTILFPFVTLGSLINFCDCLMAGGTAPDKHGEVGSSYVHFNYSPRRHKATASLFGDVPRGVMLDQPPIFLGGQGGAVGPISVEFGTVTAAGTVLRRNVDEPSQLIFGTPPPHMHQHEFSADAFGDIESVVGNNVNYIANLHALREWYRHVRPILQTMPHEQACLKGAAECLSEMIAERQNRLGQLAERIKECPSHPSHMAFVKQYNGCRGLIGPSALFEGDTALRNSFLQDLDKGQGYVSAVQALNDSTKAIGRAWLQSVADAVITKWHS